MSEPILGISGLQYVPSYLSQQAHDELLHQLDSRTWQRLEWHPSEAPRRIQCYGYQYDFREGSADYVGELPDWINEVAVRLRDDGLMPCLADQIIVNEYEPGQGILAHVDAPVFGDTIASLSLGSTCIMEFTHRDSREQRQLLVEPRSAVVLTGDARSVWRHSIPGRPTDVWNGRELPRSRRVSLTFRKMAVGATSSGT